jgi:menaquinone-dependent protoporphyrinogen oxidase
MQVLVAYASQHGSTREIAGRIAEVISDNGIDVALRSVDDAMSVDGFDAFVIGSAIHASHWLKQAERFVRTNEQVLAKHPVWLFSSGPIGEAADKPQPVPHVVTRFKDEFSVADDVVFGGSFERSSTENAGWFERTVGRFIPEGDFRSWPAIEAWASTIARQLNASQQNGRLATAEKRS